MNTDDRNLTQGSLFAYELLQATRKHKKEIKRMASDEAHLFAATRLGSWLLNFEMSYRGIGPALMRGGFSHQTERELRRQLERLTSCLLNDPQLWDNPITQELGQCAAPEARLGLASGWLSWKLRKYLELRRERLLDPGLIEEKFSGWQRSDGLCRTLIFKRKDAQIEHQLEPTAEELKEAATLAEWIAHTKAAWKRLRETIENMAKDGSNWPSDQAIDRAGREAQIARLDQLTLGMSYRDRSLFKQTIKDFLTDPARRPLLDSWLNR